MKRYTFLRLAYTYTHLDTTDHTCVYEQMCIPAFGICIYTFTHVFMHVCCTSYLQSLSPNIVLHIFSLYSRIVYMMSLDITYVTLLHTMSPIFYIVSLSTSIVHRIFSLYSCIFYITSLLYSRILYIKSLVFILVSCTSCLQISCMLHYYTPCLLYSTSCRYPRIVYIVSLVFILVYCTPRLQSLFSHSVRHVFIYHVCYTITHHVPYILHHVFMHVKTRGYPTPFSRAYKYTHMFIYHMCILTPYHPPAAPINAHKYLYIMRVFSHPTTLQPRLHSARLQLGAMGLQLRESNIYMCIYTRIFIYHACIRTPYTLQPRL